MQLGKMLLKQAINACELGGIARSLYLNEYVSRRVPMLRAMTFGLCTGAPALFAATPAMAAELNSGDTAWIIVATALVLFMTLPGLALFYAGLVRAGSVLSVIMQCLMIACIASLLLAP